MKKLFLHSFPTFSPFSRDYIARPAIAGLAVIGAMLSNSSLAQTDLLQEEIDISDPKLVTAPTENRSSQRSNLAELENRLYQVESEFDAYDNAISELSFDLANTLVSLGRVDEAHSAYNRALHITRINNGLNSTTQIPILEAVLDLHTGTHELDASGEVLNKLRRIHQDNYPESHPKNINMLEKIGIWHLSAYYSRQDSKRLFHLIDASATLIQVQHLKRATSSDYDYELYKLISLSSFLLTRQRPTNSPSSFSSFSSSSSIENDRQDQQNATQIVIEAAFRRASNVLELGIQQAQKSNSHENLILALLLKADWNQLYNRRNSARALYIDAYNLAITHLDPDNEVRKSFDRPHPLPIFSNNLLTFSTLDQTTESYRVQLGLDVSQWGVSSNIKRLDNDNKLISESAKRLAVREARSSKYRPAIVNGAPINSLNTNQIITVNL